jgi:hypothetical protein
MNLKNFDPTNSQEDLVPLRKTYFAHSVLFATDAESITIFPKSGGEILDGITFTPEHMKRFVAVAQKKLKEIEDRNSKR